MWGDVKASLSAYPRRLAASGLSLLFVVSVMIVLVQISPVARSAVTPLEFSDHGYPLGLMDKEKILHLAPNVMVLPPFSWSDQTEAGPGISIVPVLIVKDPSMADRICDYGPNMLGAIKRALVQTMLDTNHPDTAPEALYQAGHTATETINLDLGKVWLRQIYLLHEVDNAVLVAAETCQLLKS